MQSSAEGRPGWPQALWGEVEWGLGADTRAPAAAKGRILDFTPAEELWPQWKILFSTMSYCYFARAVPFGLEDAMASLLGKRLVY